MCSDVKGVISQQNDVLMGTWTAEIKSYCSASWEVTLCFVVIAEHVTSNASDSESSCRK